MYRVSTLCQGLPESWRMAKSKGVQVSDGISNLIKRKEFQQIMTTWPVYMVSGYVKASMRMLKNKL